MFQIRLLGQFDLRVEGKRVTIPSRAGQSLLAYLALTAGTPHRREKLAGVFWPDTTDENARKNLRQELWRIRKAISAQGSPDNDYLIADEFTLKFNREAKYWLDAAQLERPDHDLQSLMVSAMRPSRSTEAIAIGVLLKKRVNRIAALDADCSLSSPP